MWGKCPDCNAWNSFSEEIIPDKSTPLRPETQSTRAQEKPIPITAVQRETVPRIYCGLPELDRVLGGGLVPGSLVLISGDPGVGKSTLLLQALYGLASRGYQVLYASGEESREQIKLRADRLKTIHPNILLFNETDLSTITHHALQNEATRIGCGLHPNCRTRRLPEQPRQCDSGARVHGAPHGRG